MKQLNKFAVLGAAVFAVGTMSISALAASSYTTPAEAVAGLTGKTVESVMQERSESGKTYGTIANDAGKLPEFKSELLEMKKTALDEQVAAGTMTRERANEIIAEVEQNQANCDGTGSGNKGLQMGKNFGGNRGSGQGRGQGRGQGSCGFSCLTQ